LSYLDYLYFKRLLKEYGYELVRRGETVYIRRRPRTRDNPTPKMLQARAAMKIASASGTGLRGLTEEGLPAVAAQNRELIPQALMFLKVTAPKKRVKIAERVAAEIGLEPEEKERLIKLVSA